MWCGCRRCLFGGSGGSDLREAHCKAGASTRSWRRRARSAHDTPGGGSTANVIATDRHTRPALFPAARPAASARAQGKTGPVLAGARACAAPRAGPLAIVSGRAAARTLAATATLPHRPCLAAAARAAAGTRTPTPRLCALRSVFSVDALDARRVVASPQLQPTATRNVNAACAESSGSRGCGRVARGALVGCTHARTRRRSGAYRLG